MTQLTFKDSDNKTRNIDCNVTIDKQGKSQYAPEIVKGVICFPKAAFFRNLKQGE